MKRIVISGLLLLLAVPWLLAQDLVLDYPKFQPDLDTVYVDFKACTPRCGTRTDSGRRYRRR